jgi:peptidyl-prolyl cis-trans isomerase D
LLDGMRAASQNWIGRALMALVMGVIVVSFAIWGIGDIFRGFGAGKLGQVGSTEISSEQFRYAYQNELQRLQRQLGRVVTNDQARQAGLDRQILGRLVTEAALDQKAQSLGLAMSDAQVVKSITTDPIFKDTTGQFDKNRFDSLLRDNGYTERSFVREQKSVYLRREIGEALAGEVQTPEIMTAAVDRFRNEARSVDYVILSAASVGDIPQPTDEELKKFYEARKAAFVAPQYRKIVTLAVTPSSAAKPGDISDADAMKLYDAVKTQRFGTPELREIQQIVFPSQAEAQAAADKIKAGASFDSVIAERKLSPKDVDLGTVTRSQVNDAAVGDMAFSLKQGDVSPPVKNAFGYALVRVQKIIPEVVKPFAEVANDLKAEIARDRAKKTVQSLHDKIEDQRASGKPLAEAARSVGLEATTVDAIDAQGTGRNGAPVEGLTQPADLIRAVFASDVGVDNETIQTKDGGYIWFEVLQVDPSRQLSLDEVKDKATAAWREDVVQTRLAAKAADMVKQLKGGAELAKLAEADKVPLKNNTNVKRTGAEDLDPATIVQIFNQPNKGAGSSSVPTGRLVFQILDTSVPNFNPDSDANKQMSSQLKQMISDDIMTQYVQRLQRDYGVSVNETALRDATGGGDQ